MKAREFEVPTSIVAEFASLLIDLDLTNEIIGLNENADLIIQISYENKEKEKLFALVEFMDDYYGENAEA